MRTETPESRDKGIRKDQSVWKHIECNGKIPTRVQGRACFNHAWKQECCKRSSVTTIPDTWLPSTESGLSRSADEQSNRALLVLLLSQTSDMDAVHIDAVKEALRGLFSFGILGATMSRSSSNS